jgi:hypothetical protein
MSGTTDSRSRKKQLNDGYDQLTAVIAQHLHYLFSHGVLGLRDAGDRGGFALKYRSENRINPAIRVKVAGRAWHCKGRYGALIGRYPEDKELSEAYLEESEPSDFVKIVNSGLNSLCVYGHQTSAQFSEQEIASLVKAASAKGQKVMAHANGVEPVKNAIVAGCHSIEHGFFMGRDNLQRMADQGTFWVPTLYTMKAYGKNLAPGEMGADLKVVEKNLTHQLEQLRLARELGVKVALGTDSGSLGVLHGESMMEEMKLFKKAGYSLAETLRCATVNGAKLLGIDSFGELVPGKRATFIVSRGAPSQLPRKLAYLENIYVDGCESADYQKNPINQ